jgi:hypothetical protein
VLIHRSAEYFSESQEPSDDKNDKNSFQEQPKYWLSESGLAANLVRVICQNRGVMNDEVLDDDISLQKCVHTAVVASRGRHSQMLQIWQ